MTSERWEQVKGMIKDKFQVLAEHREPFEDGRPGELQSMEFVTPAGRMLLEWTDEPLKLSTKAIGSKRIGSAATVVHEYSDHERVHRFTVYRWDEPQNDWVEVRKDSVGLFSATF